MPPKLSKADKQTLIVTHLQTTGTCYTLKDLEKILPSVASINSIQVKEFIQALTDENLIRVEKIGSGNWYWSFGSDAKLEREHQLNRVQTEVEKARKSHTELVAALAAETTRRKEDEAEAMGTATMATSTTNLEGSIETAQTGIDALRKNLLDVRNGLEAEVHRLRVAETGLGDSVCQKSGMQLRRELAEFRQQALQWTDNLYVLEQHLRELAGGDKEIVAAVLRECYGDEYVDGSLREL
ncbi:GAJ protein [Penicillium angulare]|uniref:GAJ protein n=1 Tax=Penicillium angulare TaxID=116970 RepID=UPI00253F9EA3|nr:GAJ protein [Penicillium angulare]KAJ5287846.1 GAJ protein [Penicillium angulare]